MTDSIDDLIDPLWKMNTEFTVEHAAALLAGYDPINVGNSKNELNVNDKFPKLLPTHTAITTAINAGKLIATIRRNARLQGWDEQPAANENSRLKDDWDKSKNFSVNLAGQRVIYCESPDWSKTTIAVEDLRTWLRSLGFNTGFFFPTAIDSPDYLDQENPRYAPKLAAAIRAWQEVTDTNGKSPKKAIEKWLTANAAQFGLVGDDDKPITQAIEDCSKVANWKPGGGAPKTPNT